MYKKQRPHPTIFLSLFALLLLIPAVFAQEESSVEYLRYDVEITLHENGDFTVREIQQLRFNDTFSEGFADIPLGYLNEISDIRVFGGPDVENLQAYTDTEFGLNSFTYEEEGDALYITWHYMATNPGDELTFVIEYDVSGGLWVYPEFDTLEWRAVAADRSGLPVPTSRVTCEFAAGCNGR